MRFSRRQFAALAGAAAATPLRGAEARRGFLHGVASGDPLADRVVLWSRISGYDAPVDVTVAVAEDPNFERVVRRFELRTDARRDYTLKVDATGLGPGRQYFYRFDTATERSMVGRTRTLPAADADRIRLAIVSCANYPAGFFNVYRALGNYNDLDAIVHLGDYFYEYPADGYASSRASEFGRLSSPLQEVVALADYRMRHAQYKSDPDLQYAHARAPFIAIWDDHEIANDAWTDGAQNHQDDEGSYAVRREAALAVYREWMPIRDEGPAYRRFDFGRLATLAMVETRVTARTQPLSYGRDLTAKRLAFRRDGDRFQPIELAAAQPEAGDVVLPLLMNPATGTTVSDPAAIQELLDGGRDGVDYIFAPDIDGFVTNQLGAADRELLGAEQLDWLTAALTDPAGGTWRIVGNQTLMSDIRAPDFSRELSGAEVAELPAFIRGQIPLTRYGLPINLDAWSGYPAERARVLERMAAARNVITIAGDTHNAWAGRLQQRAAGPVSAYELGTPSVTSPGIAELMPLEAPRLEALFRDANPSLDYVGVSYRGFIELNLTAGAAEAVYFGVNRTDERRFSLQKHHRITLPATG